MNYKRTLLIPRTTTYLIVETRRLAIAIILSVILFAHVTNAETLNWDKCILTPESFITYQVKPECFDKHFVQTIDLLASKPPLKYANLEPTKNYPDLGPLIHTLSNQLQSLPRGLQDQCHFILGLLNEYISNFSEAIKHYKRSLSLREQNPLCLYRLASIMRRQNKFEEASNLLKELYWRTSHNSSEILYCLGETLLAANKDTLALPYLRKAAFDSGPHAIAARRGLVTIQQKMIEQTLDPNQKSLIRMALLADLNSILAQAPDDRDTALILVRLLLEQSDPLINANGIALAEQLSRRIVKSSKHSDVEAVRLLFDTLIKKRELKKAERELNMGLTVTPDAPTLQEAKDQLTLENQASIMIDKKNE